MKRTGSVALIGGVASVAAAMLPGDAGQAWGDAHEQAFEVVVLFDMTGSFECG